MTTRLKFDGTAADGAFTEIAWKPLNPEARNNVLVEKTPVLTDAAGERPGEPDGFGEPDGSSERLAEMSLGALLYHVLIGEGKITDEPA